MAVVFVLGPSEWDAARGPSLAFSPRSVRDRMRDSLVSLGHQAFLMEEAPDEPGEDMVDKFERLLGQRKVTDVFVYWPPRAKMQTTYDELILLRTRVGRQTMPNIWVLHHSSVARIKRGEFLVIERGNRSRYLDAVARLGVRPASWEDHEGLLLLVQRLAAEL